MLRGGLVANRSYAIIGHPGAGKTTLGNQVAYHHVRGGGTALYVTLLTEPHDRMLANIADYAFSDPAMVGDRLRYISLADELGANGLAGILVGLRELVLRHRATLLVLDGSNRLVDGVTSRSEQERFLVDLLTQLSALGCTTLLLAYPASDFSGAISTHTDGVIELRTDRVGSRDVRFLRVIKCRGTSHLLGQHEMAIATAGIEVYPRLEVVHSERRPAPNLGGERRRLGVPGLDEMLGGGLRKGRVRCCWDRSARAKRWPGSNS